MRILICLLALCMACPSSSSENDAGESMDAATSDASSTDAGSSGDSGPQQDAALEDDTGPAADAGAADVGAADASADDSGSGPAECSADIPCSGACTGRSCGATWYCVTDVGCTDDIATYCGCDGTTFTGSSTCPPRPFASRGPCSERGASCDDRKVSCRMLPPECERGFVPEVNESGSCWTTRCVPIGECGCSSPEECPNPDQYTCRNDTNRCTPFL